jgi:hypothetical protein
MPNEIRELESLLELLGAGTVSPEQADKLGKTATEQAAGLRRYLMISFYRQRGREAATWMIQSAYRLSAIWLNQLYEGRLQRTKRNRWLEELEVQLGGFVNFLYRHFPAYCDEQERMPLPIWEQHEPELQARWESLYKNYQDQLDASLLALITGIYRQILTQQDTLSFYEAAYFKNLLKVLPTDLPGVQSDLNTATIQTLIRYNFNSRDFIAQLLHRMHQEAEASGTDYWINQFRTIHRIPDLAKPGLEPEQASCKKQLLVAIRKESLLTKQMQQQLTAGPTANHPPIQTDYTAGQLALLVRLKVETGMYRTENITDTLTKISQCYLPRNREPLAPETLRTKYYSPDPASIRILRDRLLTLLAQLKHSP